MVCERTIRLGKQSAAAGEILREGSQVSMYAKEQIYTRTKSFRRRGIAFAMASGACYGLYTTFLTLAQTQGTWPQWLAGHAWAGHEALSPFTATFAMAALAAGLNDLFSGIWSLAVCAKNDQMGDLVKTVATKPGWVMMASAAIGGPFAATCYVVALNAATQAGNPGVIVPIAALNVTVGAILGRVMFKQQLNGKSALGIAICLAAGALIGGASVTSMGPAATMACAFALLAAIGWGFEGCVAGFGTALIDYRIGIAIRQLTAGVLEAVVLFPMLAAIGGDGSALPAVVRAALISPALPIFALSGLFAMPAYSFWYKGNSMCGAALGMACNGMYAFWAPLFMWLLLGVAGIGGAPQNYPPLSPAQWIGAGIMVAGIFCIAWGQRSSAADQKGEIETQHQNAPMRKVPLTPLDAKRQPISYAIVLLLADGTARNASDVVRELTPLYGPHRQLTEGAVKDTLATGKENGLFSIAAEGAAEQGPRYAITEFGLETVRAYLR